MTAQSKELSDEEIKAKKKRENQRKIMRMNVSTFLLTCAQTMQSAM